MAAPSLEKIMKQAKNYPTKALLYVLGQVDLEQKKRLQQQRQQLDGQSWSRKEWDHQ
ncbi:hypothetical protein [Hutsoniella sourekii]|uniref:hypothetical protein n=1 Tax=Hutsoniella sourekii TaxID=87650 RepID=UPI0004B2DED1|nr:hypothetical protein [Hutsoniella sourekii]